MNTELVSSFERNGKTYVILEFDGVTSDTELRRLGIPRIPRLPQKIKWPDINDFQAQVEIKNDKVRIAIKYKGEEKFVQEYDFDSCQHLPDVDIFTYKVAIFDVTVYLRYIYVCAHIDEEEKYVEYSFEIWARASVGKTKIGEYKDKINLQN